MFKTLALLAALAFGSFAAANATPINGSLGITGANDNWNTNTIHFTQGATINAVSGTFGSSLVGTTAFMYDFGYLPADFGGVTYTLFSANDGIHLDVSSVTSGYVDNLGLHMAGVGTFFENGFDPTPGTFTLNSSNSGVVTFQVTASASPVPEPASLALFGTGLLGIVGIARRKFNV